MARRGFRRGAAAIHVARKTTWFGFQPVETTLASSVATGAVFSLNAAALALRSFTIVRTHWEVKLMSDQAAGVENQSLGVGLVVVSDQVVSVGITALPLPVTDMPSSLFFLHALIFGDGARVATQTTDSSYRSIDSKAMRKVEIGQDLVVVIEGGGVGSGMIVTQGGRILVKNN